MRTAVNLFNFASTVVLFAAFPLAAWEPGKEVAPLLFKDTSYVGLGVADVDADRAKTAKLTEERGVAVTRVEEEGPAEKAGLKIGDVILEYSGQRVEGVDQFIRMVQETPIGREVKVSMQRSGSLQSAVIKTTSKKAWMAKSGYLVLPEVPRLHMPEVAIVDVPRSHMSWRSALVGIEGESLDSQLAEFFGVKEGVLVRSVVKGSAADKAGLRAGDVIVKVDNEQVSSLREISASLRSTRGKTAVPVHIVRERREISVSLTIEDNNTPQAMPRRR